MTRVLLVGVAAITMFSGYARAETPSGTAAAKDPLETTADCPMAVAGAKVSKANTSTGATLTFSTSSPEKVTELRRRAHLAADMHNKNHGSGGMRGDMTGDGMMGGMASGDQMMSGASGSGTMMNGASGSGHMNGGTMMPQSRATVTEVDHGACITLMPSDPADLKRLQAVIGTRAERMQRHGCGPVAPR